MPKDSAVMDIYHRFDFEDVLAFFEKLGCPVRIRDGYCYPYSMEAASVRDALLSRLNELKVKIKLSNKISEVIFDRDRDCFKLMTESGYIYEAEKVILSCAGAAAGAFGCDGSVYEILRSLGAKNIYKPLPALVGLTCDFPGSKELAGVRAYAQVTLFSDDEPVESDSGEIIFSAGAISGIPVMNLSRYASRLMDEGKTCRLSIDFFEEISPSDLEQMIKNMLNGRQVPLEEAFAGLLNHKLLKVALRESGNRLFYSDSEELKIKDFIGIIKNFKASVTGTNGFENAQVTTGGLSLSEIDPASMETVFCKGLYVTGETLDVDGRCGGYNLQWAWSTGAVAGACAAMGEFVKDKLFMQ